MKWYIFRKTEFSVNNPRLLNLVSIYFKAQWQLQYTPINNTNHFDSNLSVACLRGWKLLKIYMCRIKYIGLLQWKHTYKTGIQSYKFVNKNHYWFKTFDFFLYFQKRLSNQKTKKIIIEDMESGRLRWR